MSINEDVKFIYKNTRPKSKLGVFPDVASVICRTFRIFNRSINQLTKAKESMDKKMHKITQRMKAAEKDIRQGKKKAAVKVLKKAEKKNEKLVKIDRTKRDPLIDKAKKVKARFPKDWGKVK